MGDLPVPPIARLPTQMMGRLNFAERRTFMSYKKLRMRTTRPYNSENGNNNMRNDRRKKELKFINTFGGDAIAQRYVKRICIIYHIHRFKIGERNPAGVVPA